MTTISSTFTAVGVSASLYVRAGSSMTFALTGTWVGTVILEHSQNNGISWDQLGIYAANANSSFTLLPSGRIRYRCTVYTSGTVSYTMANVAEVEQTFQNSAGTTVLTVTNTGISTVDLAASGNATVAGDVSLTALGKSLKVKVGAAGRLGNAVLVGGTVTVAVASISATTSYILLSPMTAGGTPGKLTYTISDGVSFTITSDSGTDTSTITYLIVDAA